jgi:uncharacterized membrane protein YedE/YeeE
MAPEQPSAAGLSARAGDGEPLRLSGLVVYLLIGTFFGFVLVKSEVVSWFRIQEMFRFHSVHMYGIIGSALLVAAVSVALIQRLRLTTLGGEEIVIPPKAMGNGTRYWLGGTLFGFGWALTGACPGPLFALVGSGAGVIAVVLVAAVAGMWVYGSVRSRLPH